MENLSIRYSVGENAKNQVVDVRVVQSLINKVVEANKLKPLDTLKTDGVAGRKTKHAIREYQRRVIGMSAPDGRVDPDGRTIKKLIIESSQQSPSPNAQQGLPVRPLFNPVQKSPIEMFLGLAVNASPIFNLSHFTDPAFPLGNAMDLRNATKEEFVNKLYAAAKLEQKTSAVPAAITTAQAILETGYGKAVPIDIHTGKYSFNLFGIKGIGPAGFVSVYTHEFYNGKKQKIVDKFKAYHNFSESITGRTGFLKQNKRYKSLFATTDPESWAKGLQSAGYATDPKYADKLISIMNKWNLK
jgi:peptidoglycan hydrolase-like protein with peptidoglycan-binding domain